MIWIAVEPVPITPTRSPSSGDAVIPLGAVEVRALEGVETGDGRPIGVVQHTGGGNDDIRLVFALLTGPNLPAAVNEFAGPVISSPKRTRSTTAYF